MVNRKGAQRIRDIPPDVLQALSETAYIIKRALRTLNR
jgi:hypothetical protein